MTQPTTTAQWAKQITTAWRSSLAGILRSGRLLTAAKKELPHGQFMRMIENELPFSASTAERLMKIAGDRRLRDPAHAPILPRSWFVLYKLTMLSDAEFTARIADGSINPDMERGDIEPGPTVLRHYYVPPSKPQPTTKLVPVYAREEPPAPTKTISVRVTHVERPPLPYESMTAPDRVIEALELLDELLADEATASEIVELLRTRGEDFIGAIRALQALADLAARCGAVD